MVIAAAKGHEKSVKRLIRLGADFWNDNEESQSAITPNENLDDQSDDTFSDIDSEYSFVNKS